MQKLNDNNIAFIRNGGNEILPGLISLSFEGKDGEAILHRMDLMGISVSTGSACNSRSTQISHVLRAILLPESLAKGTIRISLGKDNTLEDVNAIVVALKRILSMWSEKLKLSIEGAMPCASATNFVTSPIFDVGKL